MYQQTDGLDVARENDTHEHSGGVLLGTGLLLVSVWGNWSTSRCPYEGTGLRRFYPFEGTALREFALLKNISTGFYPFEGTALRLLTRLSEHVYEYPCVNGNMPTNGKLSGLKIGD